ncbi:MAG TPA: DUF929 family protein [Chloroflexota bacterium]|nr:DUF929 family protein [Chloroflexota bacterium]
MSTRQARRRQQRTNQRRGRPAPRKQTPWYFGPWGLGGAIAAIVVVVVIIAVEGSGAKAAVLFKPHPVPAPVLHAVTRAPASTVAAVGSGGQADAWTPIATPLPPLLTSGGKPEFLYIGAEYCPFCATERWAMINALSRFGTFSGLKLMKSSSTDVYPSTNTFTTRSARYSSRYVSFASVEETDNTGKKVLQVPTSEQQSLYTTYSGGGIPFIDLSNRATAGVGYDPGVLHVTPSDRNSGPLSWQTIAADMTIPTTPQTKGIIGNANWLTAGICHMTGNQPASVCKTPTISGLEAQLQFHR